MIKSISILISLFLGIYFNITAQVFSPYFIVDQHDKYINYLINSGKLKITHPLNQPFVSNELLDSLPVLTEKYDKHWLGLLEKDLGKYATLKDTINKYGKLMAGIDGGIRGKYEKDDFGKEFYGLVFADYAFKNFGIFYRFEADEAFKSDSMYFGSEGKLGNSIYYRTSDAYIKWDVGNVSFFAGRVGMNWGMMNEPSLVLSDNPLSYDRIGLVFSNRVLKFTTFFTRLEDIYGYDIRDSVPVYAWNKRYLAMHRFEIAITSKIEVAFTETMLFGGENQNVLFQYINPANFFFLSKLGERKGVEEDRANAAASIEVFYKPIPKITFFAQFLLDDMDFTEEFREQYPDRIGISSKLTISDLWPGSQVWLRYNRISNWTYNAFYTSGNFIYYGRSLGYPEHGDENLSLGMDVFRFSPFMMSLNLSGERERKQELQALFIAEKTDFPVGIGQNSFSAAFNLTYYPRTYIYADLGLEYVYFDNYEHIEGQSKGFFNVFFTVKASGIFEILNR